MERCDGSLAEALPLPPRAVVEVGLQVCAALTYAHEALGLVHRLTTFWFAISLGTSCFVTLLRDRRRPRP